MLIVLKFGGTSLLDRERILRAARRARALQQQGAQVVVVVSARGHTTDAIVADMAELCRTPDAREADMCLSSGEQLSAGLMALALRSLGCDAVSLTGGQAGLVTDSCHGNARVITLDSRRIRQELAGGKVVVVAGFQGISESGDITTVGRAARTPPPWRWRPFWERSFVGSTRMWTAFMTGIPGNIRMPRNLTGSAMMKC